MTEVKSRGKVLEFARRPFAAVAAIEDPDGKGVRLLEPGTGKELRIRWGEIVQVEERVSPLRPAPYLVLLFEDGRQMALADVGFAFAPSTIHTGPLPDLPPTFCFADFRHLSQGIEALLAEEGREKEALGAILPCIPLLDAALSAALDGAPQDRRLDGLPPDCAARGRRAGRLQRARLRKAGAGKGPLPVALLPGALPSAEGGHTGAAGAQAAGTAQPRVGGRGGCVVNDGSGFLRSAGLEVKWRGD